MAAFDAATRYLFSTSSVASLRNVGRRCFAAFARSQGSDFRLLEMKGARQGRPFLREAEDFRKSECGLYAPLGSHQCQKGRDL
jgi:hypothetical protein